MTNPFQVVKDFEAALCDYTGAPYCVTTTSCTMALLLAVAWRLRGTNALYSRSISDRVWEQKEGPPIVEIPKHTYVGVPMSIIHAGGRPTFRDEDWRGMYELKPLNIWDSARWLAGRIWEHPNVSPRREQQMICLSFHWAKTLGVQQGGAILHADKAADKWLRMARFDGRQEGVQPKDQKDWIIGHHAYMSPETAAAGLVRLALLPQNTAPLPWGPGTDSDYPNLSQMEIFK